MKHYQLSQLTTPPRICVGRHFADNMLSICIASTLHVFDITAGTDEVGQPVELSTELRGTLVTYVVSSYRLEWF